MSVQFVGVIGSGNVGRDPFDPRSFSGISRSLFLALNARGALSRAFGVEVPMPRRAWRMARNLRPSKAMWRMAFYLDPAYYRELTSVVESELRAEDFEHVFLQLGAYYDVPGIVEGRARCMSYHDGNIAQMMASPYFPSSLRREAERAFEWERQVYSGLDAIFTMSEYLRQSFVDDFGVSPSRVWNVGAGPNFEVPKELPPKDYERKKILFVGIDFDRKGGTQLVQAFRLVRSRHPRAELHIVGPSRRPEVLRDDTNGIVFHGHLSRQDPSQREEFFRLMRECTLFVLPSRYEPYGVAVVEAMSFGIPVLATDRWAFPEMIGDTGALFELDDVDGMAERMDWMLEDPGRRSEMGRRARERVLDRFSWEKVAERMISVAGED